MSSHKQPSTIRKTVKQGHDHKPLLFPKQFLWGAAGSAHQVEGWNEHNDWWIWEQKGGNIARGEVSGRSADEYHRFPEDFDFAKALGHNAHRLSIEWSRIEPYQGQWNEKEVEHYRKVLRALKDRGLKVFLTLHHFTNPEWFAEAGGWEQKESVQLFVRFVQFVAKEYKGLVDFWITINEPVVYVTQGYLAGVWPPQKKSFIRAHRAFFHMIAAHKKAYRAIHAVVDTKSHQAKVGIAQNTISLYSYRKHSLVDYVFLQLVDWFWNHSFFSFSKKCHDFIGINYYFHYRLQKAHIRSYKFFIDIRQERRDASDIGWEVYPPGILDVLLDFSSYRLPLYITENGIATDNDHRRQRYIVGYLKEIYHAIRSGVPVKGYLYWSLIDNFEWEKGFASRFGLIAVDYKTLKRTVKQSGYLLAEIAKGNAITHDHLRFLGHGSEGEQGST